MEREFFPKTICGIPIEYLRRMLELVLKCNNFKFNRKCFLQVNGTAMGTRVAPTYANLFMAHFEENIYIYIDLQLNLEFGSGLWIIFGDYFQEIENPLTHLSKGLILCILQLNFLVNSQTQKWIS